MPPSRNCVARSSISACAALEIGTTMEGVPLDDPRFDPFFAAAAELDVPVILHPYYVGTRPQLADFYMTNLTGNPLETCIAASRLILSGFLDRHPALKVVLVHAGGFMPYQIGRLDHGFRVRAETSASITSPPSSYLRRFWYDTITHASMPLKFLIELVGADRVVLGTDLALRHGGRSFRPLLFGASILATTDRAAITSGNAAALFGVAPDNEPPYEGRGLSHPPMGRTAAVGVVRHRTTPAPARCWFASRRAASA